MELACRLAYGLEEAALDVHMNVLQLLAPRERPRLYLASNRLEAAYDGGRLLFGDDRLPGQHTSVGYRSGDILPVKPPVVADG